VKLSPRCSVPFEVAAPGLLVLSHTSIDFVVDRFVRVQIKWSDFAGIFIGESRVAHARIRRSYMGSGELD
jgi:hypothetical protein